ncbi:hypothetical protein EUGRSUZ_H03325, partial [Eucalyptus grandis]
MTKPITEAAITAFFSTIAATMPASLTIADLGCSCGPNTLFAVSEIISIMIDLCNAKKHKLPEFQVFLNDLPGNDFNTLFSSFLPRFQEKLSEEMNSKYGALHWMSQVPRGLEENKGNISMSRSSPPSVLRAYYEQFQRDFSTFLECRGQELVMGGRMVLTLLGQRSDDPSSEEYRQFWELLAIDLNEMVTEVSKFKRSKEYLNSRGHFSIELVFLIACSKNFIILPLTLGLLEEEKLDSFNVPYYPPSPKEVRREVEKQGSFSIDCLEVFEVNRDVFETDCDPNVVLEEAADKMVGCLRAIAEPLLVYHFSEEIINEVFKRFRAKLGDRLSMEKIAL